MRCSVVGLLIAVNDPAYAISHPIAVSIEFLVQYLLAVDDLSAFKGVFQGLYIYGLKDIILEFYRWEPLLSKIWLFDNFLVVFR